MKKALLTLIFIFALIASSVAANTMTVHICAYVPEKVTFEATDTGYEVNSTTANVSYGFFDTKGNETDAYNASVFNVVAL